MGDENVMKLVKSIIQLSQSMGLETVAEGIEEAEEGRILKELGCTLAQGYHYAKPMEEADVIAFIRNTKPFEI